MSDFDISGLDAFAKDLTSFDFMSEVQEAAKKIEKGTIRQRKNAFTIRSLVDLDDSLALAAEPSPVNESAAFHVGAKVWARYDEDELFYEAVVTERRGSKFLVTFTGYGNEQETLLEHLRPHDAVTQETVQEMNVVPQTAVGATQEIALANQEAAVAKAVGGMQESSPVAAASQDAAADELDASIKELEAMMREAEPEIALKAAAKEEDEGPPPIPAFDLEEPAAEALPPPRVPAGVGREARQTLRDRKKKEELEKLSKLQEAADLQKKKYEEMTAAREREMMELEKAFREADEAEKQKEEKPQAQAPPPKMVVLGPEDTLALTKSQIENVEEMIKALQRELKEVTQRRLLRAQMREEVLTESVNAITAQRNAIRYFRFPVLFFYI